MHHYDELRARAVWTRDILIGIAAHTKGVSSAVVDDIQRADVVIGFDTIDHQAAPVVFAGGELLDQVVAQRATIDLKVLPVWINSERDAEIVRGACALIRVKANSN